MSTTTLEFLVPRPPAHGTDLAIVPVDFLVSGAPKPRPWRSRGDASVTSFERQQFTVKEIEVPSWSFHLLREGISGTLRSIETLPNETDEGDGYPAVPSAYALDLALRMVERAGALMMTESPVGSACSDVNGGIRVTWRAESRELRLVVPGTPNGRGYLYLRSGSKSGISDALSFDTLAARLAWLSQE